MGISTQRVKLDIGKQASMQVIRLGQGDRNGTTLVAELYDGGSPYSLSGKTARFTMRTPDGRSSYSVNASSTSNNTATFNIDERYAAGVAGTTDVAYVEVLSGSTIICSTSRMGVICLQSATEGVSPSQMHDNGLDAAIAAANAAASSANTAASNANTKASRAETATTSANTARDNANTAASAANTAASAATTAAVSATTAAEAANSAKEAANAAATAANTAAGSANAATSEANAAIEAIGDISELAVPEMTASVRGGAKVGGSTQVVDEKLEVKLSESDTGTSVTTGSTSALRELQVHGQSVQDGTPTPDAPVPVQVVQGGNLQSWPTSGNYSSGGASIARGTNGDTITVASGTTSNVWALSGSERPNYLVHLMPGTYVVTCPDNLRLMVLSYDGGTWTNIASNTRSPYTLTLQEASDILCMYSVPNGTAAGTYEGWVQLEAGTTATPYVPYGSIGIVVGDTATSINLQGNTLASLPDGTHDELHIDSAGRVWIDKRVGYVSTNDLSANVAGAAVLTNFVRIVCSGALTDNPAPANSTALNRNGYCNVAPFTGAGYSSDTLHCYAHLTGFYLFAPVGDKSTWDATTAAEWVTEHGAYAYYTPAATTTIELGYIDPPAIPSGSVVTVSASLTPTFDLACWTEHASELADMTATLANEISSLRAQIAALATS